MEAFNLLLESLPPSFASFIADLQLHGVEIGGNVSAADDTYQSVTISISQYFMI